MMPNTKIEHLCESVIEACWMAALAVTPLFFNIFSSRIFEPEKESVLSSLAIIMAASWLIKVTAKGRAYCPGISFVPSSAEGAGTKTVRSRYRHAIGIPFLVPVCMLAAAYLISTLISMSPYMSWHGSYERAHGTLTIFSYITIFFLTVAHLRTAAQWDRISHTILLTSVPVSLYAIFQQGGHDPVKWGVETAQRVTSTLGNPIFMSAYLNMVVCITLGQMISLFSKALRRDRGRNNKPGYSNYLMRAGVYSAILILQLTASIFSQSRGPMLGLVTGLFVFSLLILLLLRNEAQANQGMNNTLRRALKGAWKMLVAGGIAIILFLAVFSMPDSPLAFLKDIPYVNRLGSALDLESRTAKVRTYIWESAVNLLSSHEPVVYPDGSFDTLSFLRKPFGYGPETMQLVYGQYYPPGLAHYENRDAVADRSHNDVFDSLITTGIFGALASVFLFASVFYYALKQTGLVPSPKERNILIMLMLSFGILGIVIPKLLTGSFVLSGPGLPAGIVAGIISYLIFSVVLNRHYLPSFSFTPRNILMISLFSLTMAHFVEIQFGIPIITTRTYFWFLIAVLAVTGTGWMCTDSDEISEDPTAPPRQGKKGNREGKKHKRSVKEKGVHIIPCALITGMISMTLLYDFTANYERNTDIITVAAHTLTRGFVNGETGPSYIVFLLFAATFILSMAVAVLTDLPAENDRLRKTLIFTAVSVAVFLLSVIVFSMQRAEAADMIQRHADFSALADHIAAFIVTYHSLLLFLTALTAVTLWRQRGDSRRWFGNANSFAVLCGVIILILAALGIRQHIVGIKADIYHQQGQGYYDVHDYDKGIYLFEKAIRLAPQRDYYYIKKGKAELAKAEEAKSDADRDLWFNRTISTLQEVRRINPLLRENSVNLGRAYRIWGVLSGSWNEKKEKWREALHYYEQALRLSPNTAHLWNEYGMIYQLMGNNRKARDYYQTSLSLDAQYDQTYLFLGVLLMSEANTAQSSGEHKRALDLYKKAIVYHEEAFRLNPQNIQACRGLGYLYAHLNDTEKAIGYFNAVLSLDKNDLYSHENLIMLYTQAGRYTKAREHARTAKKLAPKYRKNAIDRIIQFIQGESGYAPRDEND